MKIDDQDAPKSQAVTIVGSDEPCGIYVLRMEAETDIGVRFGRFRGASTVPVSRGDLLYVGSAMARTGSMTLARRLLRHASRSSAMNPHPIRGQMLDTFIRAGLMDETAGPPRQKKLFWNIDYLLEERSVTLVQAYILRTHLRLEDEVAGMIAADPASAVVAPGLGAHDRPGQTHLFYIGVDAAWWDGLATRLSKLTAAASSYSKS
jgi:Uri superfamily endonuclease